MVWKKWPPRQSFHCAAWPREAGMPDRPVGLNKSPKGAGFRYRHADADPTGQGNEAV